MSEGGAGLPVRRTRKRKTQEEAPKADESQRRYPKRERREVDYSRVESANDVLLGVDLEDWPICKLGI